MKLLSSLLACTAVAALGAQTQTLVVAPVGSGFTYNSNTACNFFDMTVNTTVTLRSIRIPCQSPIGTVGSIQLWRTTSATSHIGNEQIQANWTQLSSGPFTSAGYGVFAPVCQVPFGVTPDTVLQPGTYGFGIQFTGIRHQFFGVATYPGAPYADANLSVTNGTVQPFAFTSVPLNAFTSGALTFAGTQPQVQILYDVGVVPHACSDVSYLGEGSFRNTASFNQRFDTAAAGSAALQGRSLKLTNIGTGYLVEQGTATFVAPTGGETVLIAGDDIETQVTLPNLPILYPAADGVSGNQSTIDIWVHSNGYISTGPQSAINDWALDPNACMDATAQSWYGLFSDLNPAEAGSGQVSWEEDLANLKTYVTWNNVENYPNTSVNPSRFQFQFDLITGDVEVVYDLVDAIGGAGIILQDSKFIGWSPAGPSPATDPFDFATLTSSLRQLPEAFPLNLEIANAPLVGGSVNLITSQEPSVSIGINLVDIATVVGAPLPLDLFLGAAPGTTTWIDPGTAVLSLITNIPMAGSMSLTIPIANLQTLAGVEVYSQSFWLDLSQANLFTNMISSQCGKFVIGNF